MRQVELAAALGIDKTSVCHWEHGVSRPDVFRLADIAAIFDVPLSELVRGESDLMELLGAREAA